MKRVYMERAREGPSLLARWSPSSGYLTFMGHLGANPCPVHILATRVSVTVPSLWEWKDSCSKLSPGLDDWAPVGLS